MFVKTDERPQGEQERSTREPLPEAPITKMSQAIRKGCTYRPQSIGYYISNGRSCALGAAHEGLYGKEPGDEAPILGYQVMRALGVPTTLFDEITKRNDSGEPRQSIADWLESKGY